MRRSAASFPPAVRVLVGLVTVAGGLRAYAARGVAAIFKWEKRTAERSFGGVSAALPAPDALPSAGGDGKLARLRRWWLDRDKSRTALAALDVDELGNLSEIGRQIRREARRARNLR